MSRVAHLETTMSTAAATKQQKELETLADTADEMSQRGEQSQPESSGSSATIDSDFQAAAVTTAADAGAVSAATARGNSTVGSMASTAGSVLEVKPEPEPEPEPESELQVMLMQLMVELGLSELGSVLSHVEFETLMEEVARASATDWSDLGITSEDALRLQQGARQFLSGEVGM